MVLKYQETIYLNDKYDISYSKENVKRINLKKKHIVVKKNLKK